MAAVCTAYYHSPIGALKITGDEKCITGVTFAENDQPMISDTHLTPVVIQCIEQLIQYFSGELRHFDVPVSQEGSAFQKEVWNQLNTIPFGRTVSYLEIARRIGDPRSIRAVGAANGRNNVAIIIPCHRVIGADKQLVGYMGGIWRKQWLLEHEMKVAHGVQTLF